MARVTKLEDIVKKYKLKQYTITNSSNGSDLGAEKNDRLPLAVFVPQSKGAILDAKKFGYGMLGTYGAGPCCIVAAYCPSTKRAFMAHIDSKTYITDCCNKINYWIRENQSQPVQIHLLSCEPWENLYNAISSIPNKVIIQADFDYSPEYKQLILDTNGVYTSKFSTNDVSPLPNIDEMQYYLHISLINASLNTNALLELEYDERYETKNRRPLGATIYRCNYKTSIPIFHLYDKTRIDPKNNPFQLARASTKSDNTPASDNQQGYSRLELTF